MPDVTVLANTERKIIMSNPALARIFGYEAEDILGKSTDVLYQSRDEFERQGRIRFNLSAEEQREPYVVNYRRKDGNVFAGETVGTAIRDGASNTLGFIGVIRDITDRKRVEAALRDSEERFRGFSEASSDWFWEMDADCRFSYFSDRFTEITGVRQEALLGKTREETGIPDVDPEAWDSHLSKLAEHRPFRDFRHPRTRPDGRVVHLSINGKPTFDEAGNFKGYRGTGSDITEHKRAEEDIHRLSLRNEMILNSAGEGIYGLDLEGRTTFVNPAAARMIGWEPGDLIGQPLHDILHHSKPDGSPYPREECPIYAALGDGAVHQVADEEFWRKDGTSFPVEYVSTPILEDDKPVGAVVVFRDITERKRAEAALRRAHDKTRIAGRGADRRASG